MSHKPPSVEREATLTVGRIHFGPCQAVTGDRPAIPGRGLKAIDPAVSPVRREVENAGEKPAPDSTSTRKQAEHCFRELRGMRQQLPEGYRRVYVRLLDELAAIIGSGSGSEPGEVTKETPHVA